MKGRSRTNSCFSSVYSATPSAPVSAMTIAALTPAAPYSGGSARISAYQMRPSPRRLAIRKMQRGRAREAPRFSLRHRPYSAASIRAMKVLRPVALMWRRAPAARLMTGTASGRRASFKLRNCESFVAPACPAASGQPGERRRHQALRRARGMPEIQGRLGELQLQQARGSRGVADQIHARIQQCAERQREPRACWSWSSPSRPCISGMPRARRSAWWRRRSPGWPEAAGQAGATKLSQFRSLNDARLPEAVPVMSRAAGARRHMRATGLNTFMARIDAAEYGLCRRLNRGASLALPRCIFRIASRLGDGLIWYALILALPPLYGAAGVRAAIVMALTGALGVALYTLLKQLFVRERPFITHAAIDQAVAPLDRYSFPSGHTLHAVSFAWQASAHFPQLGWVLLPLAALIAGSRVVLGLHYPSDVLAGAAIGAALALLGMSLG